VFSRVVIVPFAERVIAHTLLRLNLWTHAARTSHIPPTPRTFAASSERFILAYL